MSRIERRATAFKVGAIALQDMARRTSFFPEPDAEGTGGVVASNRLVLTNSTVVILQSRSEPGHAAPNGGRRVGNGRSWDLLVLKCSWRTISVLMIADEYQWPARLRILVTGASGLIGREMCGVLADRGHSVIALLHRSHTLRRNDGAVIPTMPFDGTPQTSVVAVLDGDVTADRFGLSLPMAGALMAGVDVIIHCAAVTAFNLPQSTYDRVNVGGTAQVLAFAARAGPGMRVLHVSTAYVCGEAAGIIPEAPTAAVRFNNGYEASKAAAEALVLTAHRQGQAVVIARPSIVAGHWESGAIGAFGSIYQLFRLITDWRTGPLSTSSHASLSLVPVDHVTGALTDIAERMGQADGQIFHLTASDPVPLTTVENLAREFAASRPYPPDRLRLSPRQQSLHATVAATYASYLRPSPDFTTSNLAALSGRCCPPTDTGYICRLIRYAITMGFLPENRPAPITGRPDNTDPALFDDRTPSSR